MWDGNKRLPFTGEVKGTKWGHQKEFGSNRKIKESDFFSYLKHADEKPLKQTAKESDVFKTAKKGEKGGGGGEIKKQSHECVSSDFK